MFKISFILSVLSLAPCFAETFTEEDRKFLSDLPEPSSENLRWAIPADGWRYSRQHRLKGEFFRLTVKASSANPVILRLYESSKFLGEYVEVRYENISHRGKLTCNSNISFYERKPFPKEEVLGCTYASCAPPITKDAFRHYLGNPFSDSLFLLNSEKYSPQCPIKIDYIVKTFENKDNNLDSVYHSASVGGYNYYFKFEGMAKDRSYVEVPVNGKKHYLDIRFCKDDLKNCGVVDVKYSDYEKDWIRLKKHQQNKDIDALNILISELRPCVEKRDEACIKKFFPDKVKDDYLTEWYGGYEIPEVKVDDELIKELSTCLDYKNLLPHLYGSRGVNKVCIFHRRGDYKIDKTNRDFARLLNLTYPEAVRISNDGYSIYVKP